MAQKNSTGKTVEALKHDEATRKNIPTAEYQSVMQKNEQDPLRVAYPRCGRAGRRKAAAQPRPRPAARLARQGRAGLERPRRPRPAALHPGEGPPQGADRRPAARDPRAQARGRADHRRPLRRLQRHPARAWTRPSSTSTTRTGRTA
ncbi:MAG: hypothetical protein MZV70_01935 [Desulfobacterales bacterium]|nr:hypothetical protein [Desulfobacterales bacterium]